MFNEAIIQFLNDLYDEAVESGKYTNHELEIISKFIGDNVDKLRKKWEVDEDGNTTSE